MPKLDMNRVKKERAAAEEEQARRGNWFTANQGKNLLRMCPPWSKEGVAMKKLEEHKVSKGRGNFKNLVCPRSVGLDDCYICDVVIPRLADGTDADNEIAHELRPQQRFYANVVDLTTPKTAAVGPQIWGFSKQRYLDLLDLIDGDYDDITDTKKGTNLVLIRKGKGKNDTTYTMIPKRNTSPLPDAKAVLAALHDLDVVLGPASEDEQKRVLRQILGLKLDAPTGKGKKKLGKKPRRQEVEEDDEEEVDDEDVEETDDEDVEEDDEESDDEEESEDEESDEEESDEDEESDDEDEESDEEEDSDEDDEDSEEDSEDDEDEEDSEEDDEEETKPRRKKKPAARRRKAAADEDEDEEESEDDEEEDEEESEDDEPVLEDDEGRKAIVVDTDLPKSKQEVRMKKQIAASECFGKLFSDSAKPCENCSAIIECTTKMEERAVSRKPKKIVKKKPVLKKRPGRVVRRKK